MKNKFLLAFAFASMLSLGSFSQENYDFHVSRPSQIMKAPTAVQTNEFIIKNCGDEVYGLGGLNQKVSFKIMNKVSAGNAALLKGNKLTKIFFGLGREQNADITGISNVKVFVTEDPEGEYLVSKTSDETTSGWHEVVLDEQYEITGKEFYIGYEADLAPKRFGIGIGDGNYELTTFYVDNVKNQWQPDYGIASIYGVAEGDVIPDKSSLTVMPLSVSPYVKSGEEVKVDFIVSNGGFEDVTSVDVSYAINGGKEVKETVSVNIKPGESKKYTCSDVCTVTTGVQAQDIVVTVVPTDKEDVDLKDNTITVTTNVYADDAVLDGKRKILFEQFTTEKCPNCPRGDEIISKTLANYDNVIRMSHHSGYYQDKLTTEYGENICYYFFNSQYSFAPACMINRKFREGYPGANGAATGPIFGVNADAIRDAITADMTNPLFATVNIDTKYNKDNRELDITVSGKCSLRLKNLTLSIVMTEDGIKGYQAGAGSWTHEHAVRATITDMAGAPVKFDEEGNYSYNVKYVIPESIKSVDRTTVNVNNEKINIVAFLCEMNTKDPLACEVLNAEIAEKPAVTTAIKDINNNDVVVYAENGYLVVDGEFESADVYSVNGVLVKHVNAGEEVTSVSDLNAGVYMVKVKAGGQSNVAKIVITE